MGESKTDDRVELVRRAYVDRAMRRLENRQPLRALWELREGCGFNPPIEQQLYNIMDAKSEEAYDD